MTAGAAAQTDTGLVEGLVEDGLTVYRGIPFAAPPTGDLRWRAPQPAAAWTGVRRADAFAPACPQDQNMNSMFGFPVLSTSEDCLYLNVWTPAASPGERLPVMVWIYGGGFAIGSTAFPTYSGEALAKKGVVVVSIAYRVGPIGFLAHPELSAESGRGSGNYGLLDQIAGLDWVRRNIAGFGGDPGRVTVFGESAGGISASMLAASPLAKGLFHGAISQSGGSFAPAQTGGVGGANVPPLAVAEAKGADFLGKLGASTLAEARALPADALVRAAGPALGGFWPVLDGHVIPDDQYRLYRAGRYNDTPVLIGSNGDEGALFVQSITVDAYVAQTRAGFGEYADRILAAYPAGSDAQALRSARDLFRETGFAWHTWAWARLQARTGKGRVFLYYFDHRPPYPNMPMFKDFGAGHGADIAYVFGHPDPNFGWSAEDRVISDAMAGYWTNFARTGDPNGPGLPPWPAFTEAEPATMHFTDRAEVGPTPNLDKLEVVEGYYAWRRGEGPA